MKLAITYFALLCVCGLSACQKTETLTQALPRPAQIWVVDAQAHTHMLTWSGEVKARFEADLAFRVGGKVTARQVDLGNQVVAGQVLVSLDPADLRLNLSNAKAAVTAAEADLSNATAELSRIRELHRKQFIGQAALDAAQAAHDAAAARLAAARSQQQLSANQTAYTALKADQAGIITQVMVENGQVVGAGQPIMRIAYDGEREVHIRVGENSAQQLQVGQITEVKLWAQADKPLQGKIREISPATDATRSFLVKISLLNPPSDLRLGVTADVNLPTNQTTGTWLPASALFQQQQQTAVWVVNADNSVQLQPVTLLEYREDGVIVSDLPKGSKIIATGIHKLSVGQIINPVPYDGKAGS